MNDLTFLLSILASVSTGAFLGGLIVFLCFRYAFSQKENEIDTSDPKLEGEEVDCQIMVNVYKSGNVNMTPYTKNQEPLPDCVREEALHKAMRQLGYTKPVQAVCTKSTKLEPVEANLPYSDWSYNGNTSINVYGGNFPIRRIERHEQDPEPVEETPETIEQALDIVCEPPAGELKHLEKIKAGIQQNGEKNAKASESKAD
jgi:hypothetical protein